MRFLLILLLAASAVAAPIVRQEVPPDVEPDAELLPSGPTPSPGITPSSSPAPPISSPNVSPGVSVSPGIAVSPTSLPSASPAPSQTAGVSPPVTPSPGSSPGASPVVPGASPSASPPSDGRPPGGVPGDTDGDGIQDDFDGDGFPDDTGEPEPTTEFIEGGDSNRAALAGGLTGGIFAFLLLLLCLFCVVFGGKKRDEVTGIYTSTEAGVGPSGEDGEALAEEAPVPGALDKDTARELGPAAAGAGAGAGAAVVVAAAEESSEEVVPRGPTPPPYDYVLGAGPAATRKDFVDLRTKFERDEIGDNSAVLDMEKAGVVGEGLERDTTAAAGTAGAAGGGAAGSSALPHETETGPAVDIKPEGLPDRGGPVPMTFDSQERLMAGGDGSGAISDVAMSLNAASIAEESGDVPSLERDPIIRERDQTI